ncbi:MAG: DUF1836 domain-containing protein [Spirochaetes bacterium]|nr:DUF1836 domain-containing protein [Spirochaetota bacterium]
MSEAESTKESRPYLVLDAPSEWDRLPDIGLYMDQVVTYIEKELESLRKAGDEKLVTPSMINNYAKANLIPRTEGKKYSKQHIALLLSAFTLKRVLSVQDMASLLSGLGGLENTKAFYESFRQSMDRAAKETVAVVGKGISAAEEGGLVPRTAYIELALKLAVEASLRSYAAKMLLGEADALVQNKEPPASKAFKAARSARK